MCDRNTHQVYCSFAKVSVLLLTAEAMQLLGLVQCNRVYTSNFSMKSDLFDACYSISRNYFSTSFTDFVNILSVSLYVLYVVNCQ